MPAIDPTPQSFRELFVNVPADTPVTMLNLLRFRERAMYAAGATQPERSGRAAYGEYSGAVAPLLAGVGGRVVWAGQGRHGLIAPDGERWDEILLVEYPSTAAFAAMVTSPEYRAIVFHRTAALEDSRLVATTAR